MAPGCGQVHHPTETLFAVLNRTTLFAVNGRNLFFPFGKPSPFNPFLLFKKFSDAPERRKSKDAAGNRHKGIAVEIYGCGNACDSEECEHPPAFNAKIIFPLNYHRMKQTDNQKSNKPDQNARQMTSFYKMHHI